MPTLARFASTFAALAPLADSLAELLVRDRLQIQDRAPQEGMHDGVATPLAHSFLVAGVIESVVFF